MQANLPPETAQELLQQLPGILYRIDEIRTQELPPVDGGAAHTLYVIQKVSRGHAPPDGGKVPETTLRYYYILDGVVFEAPTLAAVMKARLLRLGWYLNEALHLATNAQQGLESEESHAPPAKLEAKDD